MLVNKVSGGKHGVDPGFMEIAIVRAFGIGGTGRGVLAGCPANGRAGAQAPATATESSASPSAAAVEALDAGKLRERATQALRDNRMYAPVGDNAMEYYWRCALSSPRTRR